MDPPGTVHGRVGKVSTVTIGTRNSGTAAISTVTALGPGGGASQDGSPTASAPSRRSATSTPT